MDVTALLLSRLQLAFTISFHIIFPAFTIGLAAWLTVLEALQRDLAGGHRGGSVGCLPGRLRDTAVGFLSPAHCHAVVALIFVSAFGTLALSFWPYMIPFVITIDEAAAPYSSLAFMFWGAGIFIFPLMLIYTVVSYSVFRGKVGTTATHY
jgi:cytochrome bd-type quinol oxidase subunit 2